MNQEGARRSAVRAPANETPRPKGITPTQKDLGSDSPYGAYCQACGHDNDRHRRGKCWTDALGEPVTRSFTHIACTCQADNPDLEASIARHPAGKDLP